jgi:putative ABC transport system permease protein
MPGLCPARSPPWKRPARPRSTRCSTPSAHASTVAQVSADLAELRAALPAGAIISHAAALGSANRDIMGQGITASSTMPYAIMAVLLAAVITASLAAAAVLAGYRRIGVLKSICFTPAQIAANRVIAAWPSFALTCSYELLMRQIRQAAATCTCTEVQPRTLEAIDRQTEEPQPRESP